MQVNRLKKEKIIKILSAGQITLTPTREETATSLLTRGKTHLLRRRICIWEDVKWNEKRKKKGRGRERGKSSLNLVFSWLPELIRRPEMNRVSFESFMNLRTERFESCEGEKKNLSNISCKIILMELFKNDLVPCFEVNWTKAASRWVFLSASPAAAAAALPLCSKWMKNKEFCGIFSVFEGV